MSFKYSRAQRTPATRTIRSPQDVEVAPGIFASNNQAARQYYVNQAFAMNKLAVSIGAQQKSKARIKGLGKELKELQKLVGMPVKQTRIVAHHDFQKNTTEPHSGVDQQFKDNESRSGFIETPEKQPIVPEHDRPTSERNESVERHEYESLEQVTTSGDLVSTGPVILTEEQTFADIIGDLARVDSETTTLSTNQAGPDESDDDSDIEIIIDDGFQALGASDTRSPYGMKTDNSDYTIELGQSLRHDAADTTSKISMRFTIKGDSVAEESNEGQSSSDGSEDGRAVTSPPDAAPHSPSTLIQSVAETAADVVEKSKLGLTALEAGVLFVPGASSYDRWSVAADYSMDHEEPCSEIDFDLWEGPDENEPEANATAMSTSEPVDDQLVVPKAERILTSPALAAHFVPAYMDTPDVTPSTPSASKQRKPFRGMGASRWADGPEEPRAPTGPKGIGERPQVRGANGRSGGNGGRNRNWMRSL
jgi:hypothetical protein